MTKRHAITAAAAAAILILTTAALGAAGPRDDRGQDRDRDRDRTVGNALDRVDALYDRGELAGALEWLDRARDLIVDEMAAGPRSGGRARSNAGALLHVLSWYEFARGRDPQLDLAARFLGEHLEMIRLLECGPDRPTHLGDLDVGTWADGKVHRIGRVDISHWADGRIHRIGEYDISYWADGRVFRLGGIDLDYRAGEDVPWRVAGVTIR